MKTVRPLKILTIIWALVSFTAFLSSWYTVATQRTAKVWHAPWLIAKYAGYPLSKADVGLVFITADFLTWLGLTFHRSAGSGPFWLAFSSVFYFACGYLQWLWFLPGLINAIRYGDSRGKR